MNKMDVLIVGVGGQGSLLASKILGNYALEQGLDVKVSEVHGMAQRGGSVVTHVRMGQKVFAPLVEVGQADVVISFEPLEAARWAKYIKPGGKIVSNTTPILPMPVITGDAEYPQDALLSAEALAVDGNSLAKIAGNSKALNCVMLGAMAKACQLDEMILERALEKSVPPKTLDVNRKALQLGYEAVKG